MAVNEKIRVRVKGYDHKPVDAASEKIVDAAKRNGATVSGPIPLPTEKEIVNAFWSLGSPSLTSHPGAAAQFTFQLWE